MEYKVIPIKTRHINAFLKVAPKDTEEMHPFVYATEIVTAAAGAGWFDPPLTPEAVGELDPKAINELFAAAMEAYKKAWEIPPS